MSELYVHQPSVEAMVGALNVSHEALAGIRAQSFIANIESALPGSGLGHTYMKAGWRAEASVRGVNGQLKEIADGATTSINEYMNREQQRADDLNKLEPR
ncbi:hypothetical protein [Nocardia lijiangensis]|uniref:hypothetical protein n=1 Tax=Nocardia lijiangensis TaxID=299618 RepID=UPI0008310011|nr:hypothetical protein [Nocardia lijiangensis]